MSLQSKYMITIESLLYMVPPRNLCFQRFCWPFYSFWGCLFAILLLLPLLPLLLTLVSRRQCGKQVCQGGGHSKEVIAISHVRIQCWVESRPWAFAWNLSFVLAFVLLNFVQSRGMFRKNFLHCPKFFFSIHPVDERESSFSSSTFFCSQCGFFGGMILLQIPTSKRPVRAPRFAIRVKPRSSHECQSLCQFPVCKSSKNVSSCARRKRRDGCRR